MSRFTFLADHLVDQLLRSAFQNLSNVLFGDVWPELDMVRDGWRSFCNHALITLVQGENPNPSDSGWLFARKARQAVGIDQDQLREPREVVEALADGFSGPVVFVDDFVGSGEQFVRTWQRRYDLPGGGTASFKKLAEQSRASFFYCNAMTTEYGLKRIGRLVPLVKVSAGNVIPSRYSLADPDSLLWPKTVRNDGIALVEAIGHRLGYNADDGSEEDWRGFHKLGLAIAFQHSVPDANLPLFFTNRNGWSPLVQRL